MGGAIFLDSSNVEITIRNSDFRGNKGAYQNPDYLSMGAAICALGYLNNGLFLLENCRFVGNLGNRLKEHTEAGGGALYRQYGSTNIVRNCLFVENEGYRGAAIALKRPEGTAFICENNTFAYNRAQHTVINIVNIGKNAGMRYLMRNCIFYGGTTRLFLGVLTPWTGSEVDISNCCMPTDYVGTTNSNGVVFQGGDNITDPPLFDVDNGYRLLSGSPCINSGTNLPWMAGAVDLYGNRRIDRFYNRVDIGAHEYIQQGTLLMVR